MTNKDNPPGDAAELRRCAEKLAREKGAQPSPAGDSPGSPEETRKLLQELRLHQVELEMQNEELRRAQVELAASKARYFDLYDLAPVAYCTISEKGLILEANLTAATLLGMARNVLTTRRLSEFILEGDQDIYYLHRKKLFEAGQPQTFNLRMVKKDGTAFWAHLAATVAKNPSMGSEQAAEGATVGDRVSRIVLTDITERKRIEDVLGFLAKTSSGTQNEPFFRALALFLAQTLGMSFVCIDRLEGDGLNARTVAVWCDGHFEDNVTYALKDTPCGDVVGKTVCCFPASVCQFFPRDQVLKDLRAESYAGVTLWSHTGQPIGLIAVIGRSPLADRPLTEVTLKLVAARAAGELERLDAEEETARLEGQLQQAQKMESVGRLAGGVAHDFNNQLGVVLGYTEMALEEMASSHPLHATLEGIRKAAEHSADLTRQLLAFARKQTIAPKVLDLNETVESLLTMLGRLIGEDITLRWQPGAALWPVKVDPSQIDQILANLCVNARDAISGVGELTIVTGNRTLDEAACPAHADYFPGDYVWLAVKDNGCGMNNETRSHLFEPFFTTKGIGKGTGLGLATIYGIVKQNHGFINVLSEPGQGATFTISLPRSGDKTQQIQAPESDPASPAERGHETLLVVEDDSTLLRLIAMLLERQGYRVLAAPTPGEAVILAREHASEIHLLMTDVIMPEMNGRDLAKNLLALYPHLKRLFMSGYTADIIAQNGVLEEGVAFLQKPFSLRALAAKVREVLDRR